MQTETNAPTMREALEATLAALHATLDRLEQACPTWTDDTEEVRTAARAALDRDALESASAPDLLAALERLIANEWDAEDPAASCEDAASAAEARERFEAERELAWSAARAALAKAVPQKGGGA